MAIERINKGKGRKNTLIQVIGVEIKYKCRIGKEKVVT